MLDNSSSNSDYTTNPALAITTHQSLLLIASAQWCGPCQRVPMQDLRDTMNIPVFKFDIDQHESFTNELGITKIPTTILYINGQIVNKSPLQTPAYYKKLYDAALLDQNK